MEKTELPVSQNKVYHLITGETLLGEMSIEHTENGPVILLKTPFKATEEGILPYMSNIMGKAPAAVQIHPMNVIWTCPLDEFELANKAYIEATTGLKLDSKETGLIL